MKVNVLETNVLHASDVVYWLDGSTGTSTADMQRVNRVLLVELDSHPNDLHILQKAGQMALWSRPVGTIIEGQASEVERARPASSTYALSGIVSDLDGKYNPRKFDINVGEGAGHAVVMYPTTTGTQFGKAGGLIGSLRLQATGQPVPWAVLELEVTTSLSDTMTFRAQADFKGDFLLSMSRLPPLPESVQQYPAELAIRGSLTATAEQAVDPEELVSMELGELESANFEEDIEFHVKPGEIRLLRSFEQDHLMVQPD